MKSYKLTSNSAFSLFTMKLFVLCTLVAAAYSLPLEGDGVPTKNVSALDSRIYNGREVTLGQFPWQAYLTITFKSYSSTCGGSLIHKRWVLTAAHCLKFYGSIALRISILLGTIDTANRNQGVSRKSSKYYVHDNFSYDNLSNDIALVKLNKKVQNTANIRPIKLGNYLDPRSYVAVSGFGKTHKGPTNTILHYAYLITMSNAECITANGLPVMDSLVCATSTSQSTCLGDDGSALVMQKNGVWKQFGVYSGNLNSDCYLGTSVFSRIDHYRSWISDKIKPHK